MAFLQLLDCGCLSFTGLGLTGFGTVFFNHPTDFRDSYRAECKEDSYDDNNPDEKIYDVFFLHLSPHHIPVYSGFIRLIVLM
jgi:hypothetical protein